ncbi:MAG: hypothetical protein KAJ03_01635 [Gammaproteobacteria bacterium]|nr:hypothetical protein [Gammaproteobacteria bacterium]
MAYTDTGGGDHEGEDWTPTTGTYAGIHYNIGTFTCGGGVTMSIDTGNAIEVYADIISVVGTMDGTADGYAGGAGGANSQPGIIGSGACGGGGGTYSAGNAAGGAGGGYGGAGGAGGTPGATSSTAGGVCGLGKYINIDSGAGSGGGGGAGQASSGSSGGRGGGWITLIANSITITGTINSTGAGGGDDTNAAAGGGGAGGMILIIGCSVTLDNGTFIVIGGDGGDTTSGSAGGGGGAGGGRIKVFYDTLSTTGITTTLTAGSGGSGPGGAGVAGSVGTYTTTLLGLCTSSTSLGQTFTLSTTGIVLIEQVRLWINTVNTSGDFTLRIYDGIAKAVEYGSGATTTVSGTGETIFDFDPDTDIPDGTATIYMELTPDAAGDIVCAVYGISEVTGGSYHKDAKPAARFELYQKIYALGHVESVQVNNQADANIVMNVSNIMLIGAVHTIYADGSGSVVYLDDFSTNKYKADRHAESGVTHDTVNDELDVADTGYLSWKIDAKYPVTGIPTLTTQIDITAGTPTIQISDDDITYYDIDTAIVDDVLTEYQLDNAVNLSFKDGKTVVYIRVDCDGAGTNTCTIKTIAAAISMITVDAQRPTINIGSANTFKCVQSATSAIDCTVKLTHRDLKYAG